MELNNEFHVNVPVEAAWAILTDVEKIAPCMPGAQLEEIEGDEYRGGVKVKVGPITAQYKGKATFIEKDEANRKLVLRAEGRDTKGQGNAAATVTATLVTAGTGTDVKVSTDLTVTGRVAQFGRGVMADVSAKLLNQFVQCLEHDILADPNKLAGDIAAASAAAAGAATGAAAATAMSHGDSPVSSAVSSEIGPATAAASGASTPSTGASTASTGSSTGASTASTGASTASTGSSTGASTASTGASTASTGATGSSAGAPEKPTVRKIDYKPAEPVDLLDTAGAPLLKRLAPIVAALLLLVWLLRRKRG